MTHNGALDQCKLWLIKAMSYSLLFPFAKNMLKLEFGCSILDPVLPEQMNMFEPHNFMIAHCEPFICLRFRIHSADLPLSIIEY